MIKVLIVDDSALVRQVFSKELAQHTDLCVVGAAPDPYVAREMIKTFQPDVMTLDIEMPRMDGITFLKKVMKYHPIPTIIVSSLTVRGGQMAAEAIDAGAVDVMNKPRAAFEAAEIASILADKVRAAAQIKVEKLTPSASTRPGSVLSLKKTTNKIIAIGASTGGTKAIEAVLTRLPANSPGIVIVQHMPEHFTKTFADRLNQICEIEVREATEGMSVIPGRAIIAPGSHHMQLVRQGGNYRVAMSDAPRVNRHKPSVDVLFDSVARFAGQNAVGILLTGMGKDGALGLKKMRDMGAYTIAQDEESSIVYGMPREAVLIDAVDEIQPLSRIAARALKATTDESALASK